jgi:hypothetical protein
MAALPLTVNHSRQDRRLIPGDLVAHYPAMLLPNIFPISLVFIFEM